MTDGIYVTTTMTEDGWMAEIDTELSVQDDDVHISHTIFHNGHSIVSASERVAAGHQPVEPLFREQQPNPFLLLSKEWHQALELSDMDRAAEESARWVQELKARKYSWPVLEESCTNVLGLIRGKLALATSTALERKEPAPHLYGEWTTFAASFLQMAGEELARLKEARKGNKVIDQVKSYIQEHYTKELELSELANLVYLTPSYLSKLFKTETGETITDYIISVRIEQAKHTLRRTQGLKTYEVGEKVGYADPVYFNKVFKKVTGMTPKEYRDRVR